MTADNGLTLPDILRPGLDLIFVGINPSIYSALRSHYFARPSNRFWAVLNQSGLVPEPVGPDDDWRLPTYGIGLTDLVRRATVTAAELTAEDFAQGRIELRATLERFPARAICFVGKVAYLQFSQGGEVQFGRQDARIGDAAVFVIPSTSGRANRLHAQRLQGLAELRAFLAR